MGGPRLQLQGLSHSARTPASAGVLAFPDHAGIIRRMKIDYGILRDRTAELLVSAALLLDDIGTSSVSTWKPDLDDLELRVDRIIEAYKRLDSEWDRLIDIRIRRDA